MRLFPSVSAKPISGIDLEMNNVAVKMLTAFAQISGLRFLCPVNAGTIGIDQLCAEPFRDDLLVIRRIWPVLLWICGRSLAGQIANSRKRKEPEGQ